MIRFIIYCISILSQERDKKEDEANEFVSAVCWRPVSHLFNYITRVATYMENGEIKEGSGKNIFDEKVICICQRKRKLF